MVDSIEIVNAHYYKICGKPWEVWIDRKHSVLGNPYSHLKKKTLAEFHVATRDDAIDSYKKWIVEQLKDNHEAKIEFVRLKEIYRKYGKLVMICWCSPSRCHGDVLKELIVDDIDVLLI